MARIHKLVKAWGSQTVGTNRLSLEKQTIKPLGDVVSWALFMDVTTTTGTATFDADGGTPSGSWLGTNVQKLINKITIKDNQNADVFEARRNEMYILAYLLSTIEADEMIFNKGGVKRPITRAAAITAQTETYLVPQRIALKDLPATVEVEIGVLDDYYTAAGTGTVAINQIEFWVRYVPADAQSFTERAKVFTIQAFSSDGDFAHLIPESIEIIRLALLCGDITAGSAGAEMNNTRLDFLTFKRGSNDEIDSVRRAVLDEFNARSVPNLIDNNGSLALGTPSGLVIVPTLAFVKSSATEFKFDINAQVAPSIFYLYK